MPEPPMSREAVDYASALFAPEDASLRALTEAACAAGMPVEWGIAPEVGRCCQLLCRAVGAKRVVEFGTLAGYSALWLARALPDEGRVLSIESNAEYAAFARGQLAKTESGAKIEVRVGTALEMLPLLESEAREQGILYDAVFLDADKAHYPAFLDWTTRVLRAGGLLLADNALRSSSWNGQTPFDPDADDPRVLAVRTFNERLAADPRFTSVILTIGDGLAAAVFHP